MTAWMSGYGACGCCDRLFVFNVERVPSVQGAPICQPCITRVNERRRAAGRPEWPVWPDAYEPQEIA